MNLSAHESSQRVMVFSFFKKPPEKMVARPAVKPRPSGKPEAPSSGTGANAEAGTASAPAAEQKIESPSTEFSDFRFSQSDQGFQIVEEADPVDAAAEEAAVLFSNGQDEVASSVLEAAAHAYHTAKAERLWQMLFDLYRLTGKKAAFEALGIEYARGYEKSPPSWRDKSTGSPKLVEQAVGSVLFRGELLGENDAGFEAMRQAMERSPKLRVDLSKVTCLDNEGCGRLLTLLQKAHKSKRGLELLGRDAIGALVEERVEAGKAENRECWLLLLELCQMQGQHDAFEDVAINYAVTFEESPPSWEPTRVATPEPVLQLAADAPDELDADTYMLRGEVKNSRFTDLPAYAEFHDPVLIDCAALRRMDFVSAGALLNVLTTIRRSGKQIVFRHPNHLVAELFGVIGLKAVATLVFAKY